MEEHGMCSSPNLQYSTSLKAQPTQKSSSGTEAAAIQWTVLIDTQGSPDLTQPSPPSPSPTYTEIGDAVETP